MLQLALIAVMGKQEVIGLEATGMVEAGMQRAASQSANEA